MDSGGTDSFGVAQEPPHKQFSAKRFVDGLDSRNDTRVARALLQLVRDCGFHSGSKYFHCELAPYNFRLPFTLLEHSAERVLARVGLRDASLLTQTHENKLSVVIPVAQLRLPEVRTRIEATLDKAHADALAMGIDNW